MPAPVHTLPATMIRPATPPCSVSADNPIECSISWDAAISVSAPATASRRAGADSRNGAPSMPKPPAAAAAEPMNTNGSSLRAERHAGVAVSAISTAVYDAMLGAIAAAASPAGRANEAEQSPGPARNEP